MLHSKLMAVTEKINWNMTVKTGAIGATYENSIASREVVMTLCSSLIKMNQMTGNVRWLFFIYSCSPVHRGFRM